jgi:hypothetical protein
MLKAGTLKMKLPRPRREPGKKWNRCGAYARSTGKPCQAPGNGRGGNQHKTGINGDNNMKTPQHLVDYLNSLTPEQAEELWMYFDGCSNEHLIEVCAKRALTDPVIAVRHKNPIP